VVVGTVVALVAAVRVFFAPLPGRERRTVWLNYARWLVAGLTFHIIDSSTTHRTGRPSRDWRARAVNLPELRISYALHRRESRLVRAIGNGSRFHAARSGQFRNT
jgi:hypothetical protein